MMKNFNDLIEKIKQKDIEVFWYGKADKKQIGALELKLDIELPESFKEFLLSYGGGGVIDSEISGIEENDSSIDNGGTVLGDTLTVREDYELPDQFAVIFFKEDEICWCIDCSKEASSNPVVSYNLFERKIENTIAVDFDDFFEDYLTLRAN